VGAEFGKAAPARTVGGERILGDPIAAGVLVEIDTRVDVLIHRGRVETGRRIGRQREGRQSEGNQDSIFHTVIPEAAQTKSWAAIYLIADVSLIAPGPVKAGRLGLNEDEQAGIPPNAGLNPISNGLRQQRPKIPYGLKKHSRQYTGRPCVGLKGTVVSRPHCEQVVMVSVLVKPEAEEPWRLVLQFLHRLGSFLKFLSWKKCCSPAVKTKSAPQSTHLRTRSWNSGIATVPRYELELLSDRAKWST